MEMVFQMTPGTEAPAELNVFLPKLKSMWMAENATHTLHNLLTLRGAQGARRPGLGEIFE